MNRVQSKNGESFLTGSSQDELVLLEMCESEKIGAFVKQDSETITIQVFGEEEQYRSLKCFEFDAERKMMTRIVQNI